MSTLLVVRWTIALHSIFCRSARLLVPIAATIVTEATLTDYAVLMYERLAGHCLRAGAEPFQAIKRYRFFQCVSRGGPVVLSARGSGATRLSSYEGQGMRRVLRPLLASAGLIAASSANAQEFNSGLVIQPVIPQDFSRGHNVSVQEQPRPDYTALGVALGGFILYPKVEVGAGATTNTYLTSNEAITSPFLYESVSARLASRWARNVLNISASTTHREYIGESRRNEHLWNVEGYGRLDVHGSFKIEADVNASKSFENLFSGEVASNVAALSQYQRNFASIKSTYTLGSVRAFAVADYTSLNFSTLPLRNGGRRDQDFRDREILGLSAQLEYARSPSVALFAQVTARKTDFDQPLPSGQPSVSSQSARILAGLNVDIAGRWRGSIGVGYVLRDYDSEVYKNRRGLAAEIRTELFITQRLTLGITGRRTIEDISAGVPVPSFNVTASVRVDYELLRNMILSASGEFLRQTGRNETYRLTAGGSFLASRRFNIKGLISYSQRSPDSLREARIETSIAFQL